MHDIINLIRPDLQNYKPYKSARDTTANGKIYLNANESPFDNPRGINRYPAKQDQKLLERLSELYNVKTNNIVLSRGSDEAIDLLIRLFCENGRDSIIICPPTYGMYSVYAALQGANIIEIPLQEDKGFQLNMPRIELFTAQNIKLIFLCSPNNPTGNILKKEDIFSLCQKFNKSIIVLDEAYIDFANSKSLSNYIEQYPNLVILRTTSKALGLAGARVGVLIAQYSIVQWVLKIIAPYPLSSIVTEFCYDMLSAEKYSNIKKQIAIIKSERKRLFNELKQLVAIEKVYQSDANFILIRLNNAEKLMAACQKNGIILRDVFDKLELKNCVRISIGDVHENTQLIKTLKGLL